MSRRDRLIPAAAFVALTAVGILILVLLANAHSNGRAALEDSLLNEVQAIAQTQDAQVRSQQGAAVVLGEDPWELTLGSPADRRRLQEIDDLLGAALTAGFFLTDDSGTITTGVNFLEADARGERLERPGMDRFLAQIPDVRGALLPVAPGRTTELPTVALVLLLRGEEGFGTFVLESEVAPDGSFNRDFAEFRRGETGTVHVLDTNGVVVASNDPAVLAEPLPRAMATAPAGVSNVDERVVAVAEVPSAGWRVVLSQDRDEFEERLTGPLQRVGTVTVVVFVAVGIAAFVALSRRLRAAREEQERLRELNETQEEFVSIVSHELRTPVAGVLGFLQTTIDHWDVMTDAERIAAVRRAASNARRLQGLTRDVLDSQSVESGRMTYAMSSGDMREEVQVAVDAARALYPGQQVRLEIDAAHAEVQMDVDRIQQVLTNLIDNAVRVSPPDAPIDVRLWTEGDAVRVSVADRGPGLAPGMEDRIFEKFVRGRSDSVTGTGLGLYISRQIVDAHGGGISVRNTPGEGATFTLELPRHRSEAAR